jgi:hypothetical protein
MRPFAQPICWWPALRWRGGNRFRDNRGTRLRGDRAQDKEIKSTREREQALDIEMGLDVIGKRVERAFHLAAIALA